MCLDLRNAPGIMCLAVRFLDGLLCIATPSSIYRVGILCRDCFKCDRRIDGRIDILCRGGFKCD